MVKHAHSSTLWRKIKVQQWASNPYAKWNKMGLGKVLLVEGHFMPSRLWQEIVANDLLYQPTCIFISTLSYPLLLFLRKALPAALLSLQEALLLGLQPAHIATEFYFAKHFLKQLLLHVQVLYNWFYLVLLMDHYFTPLRFHFISHHSTSFYYWGFAPDPIISFNKRNKSHPAGLTLLIKFTNISATLVALQNTIQLLLLLTKIYRYKYQLLISHTWIVIV